MKELTTAQYRMMAIRFSGALWQQGICPECGFNMDNHHVTCNKEYDELTNPRQVEVVFKKAFE